MGRCGMNIRFTYFCKPGRFLSCREHYVYLGGWIIPPGYIVLQHGTFSAIEYRAFMQKGTISIREDPGKNYSYLEQWVPRSDLRRHRENDYLNIGKLRQKKYNLFVGMVKCYNRRIIL